MLPYLNYTSVSFFLLGAALLFLAYKTSRGPAYVPGSIRKKKRSDLDSEDLVDKSTDTMWRMPGGMNIYHFPVEHQEGKPVIVGLHGGPGMAPEKVWSIAHKLPNFYVYHARGCGKSTHPFTVFPTPGKMWPGVQTLEQTLGIGEQIADIERIRRRLGADKIVLCGHSFGGFIATLYASEFPEHVEALILLAPAAVLKLPLPKREKGLFDTVEALLEEQGNPTHVDEYKDFLKRYFDFSALPGATDESLAKLHNEFILHFGRAENKEVDKSVYDKVGSTGGMAVYATYISMGIEHDYRPECWKLLKGSAFPVTVVHGEKDLIPPSTSMEYMHLFPPANCERVTLRDCDHFLFNSREVVKIIKETLSRPK